MSAPISKWICRELSQLLGFPTTDDIANYILAITDARDLEDYLSDLLDANVPKNRRFIDELLRKWRPPGTAAGASNNIKVYRKPVEEASDQNAKHKKKNKKQIEQSHQKRSEQPTSNGAAYTDAQTHKQASLLCDNQQTSPSDASKKKKKFVPLFTEGGKDRTAAILPGRHLCECQASKHTLINNCVACGRVVCEQEGSGPCLFCGALVCNKAEQEIIDRGNKSSEKLRQELMAIEHKDKLIHYDRTSVKRTQVIDDESDYFSTDTNQWLSTLDREALRKRQDELREKRHGSRREQKVTLDIAGRRVVEEKTTVNMYDINDTVVQQVHYGQGARPKHTEAQFSEDDFTDLVNPHITQAPPQFVETEAKHSKKSVPAARPGRHQSLRIQDDTLQQMSDDGACLSMHQPWASLLIAGIKIHEGRTWYSTHRGRLWIASTAKPASHEDIQDLQHSYTARYPDISLEFPLDYPVACLLGCVDVIDVLDSDTYNEQFPAGESSSPYVFICANPQELVVKFPIKGKHKIYKLESHVHKAAKRGLRKS